MENKKLKKIYQEELEELLQLEEDPSLPDAYFLDNS